jgi:hypothetical protein
MRSLNPRIQATFVIGVLPIAREMLPITPEADGDRRPSEGDRRPTDLGNVLSKDKTAGEKRMIRQIGSFGPSEEKT